ncbi:MAG: glycosyltransferase family 2 protein [Thermoguttaceae bacterium]
MPRLSIVIPVLGHLKRLEDTLISVLENRPRDCQIVVVLNHCYDDPYDLRGEVCFVETAPAAGFAAAVNQGITASRGAIVHLLTCGAEATPGWSDAALSRFDDPRVGAVAPLVLNRFPPRRVISAGLAFTAAGVIRRIGLGQEIERLAPLRDDFCGADTLAAFYRKSALEAIGRFPGGMAGPAAAVHVALELRRARFRSVQEFRSQAYAAPELIADQSPFRRGLEAERLFWQWKPAHDWNLSLPRHAALAAWQCLESLYRPSTACHLAGRLAGALRRKPRPHAESETPPAGAHPIGPPHFARARQTNRTDASLAE